MLQKTLHAGDQDHNAPFLICGDEQLTLADVAAAPAHALGQVTAGDVVALIGDFEPQAIQTLLRLFDLGTVVASVQKTGRAVICEEDSSFAGSGAEIYGKQRISRHRE